MVVDSLQLAPPPLPAPQLDERVALAVRALKALAVERNLAVLALPSCRGTRADRPDPRPTLDDLGALGAIKQNADVVLGIYREEMYRPGHGVEGATELIVAKNRNGPTGFVDLFFYPRLPALRGHAGPGVTPAAQDAGLAAGGRARLSATTAPDSSTSDPDFSPDGRMRTQSGGPSCSARRTMAPPASLASLTNRQLSRLKTPR